MYRAVVPFPSPQRGVFAGNSSPVDGLAGRSSRRKFSTWGLLARDDGRTCVPVERGERPESLEGARAFNLRAKKGAKDLLTKKTVPKFGVFLLTPVAILRLNGSLEVLLSLQAASTERSVGALRGGLYDGNHRVFRVIVGRKVSPPNVGGKFGHPCIWKISWQPRARPNRCQGSPQCRVFPVCLVAFAFPARSCCW